MDLAPNWVRTQWTLESTDERQSGAFLFSAYMFRIGLALVTFEQVRPFGIMLSDYCFFLSLLVILPSVKSQFWKSTGTGVLLGGTLILFGALLSLVNESDRSGSVVPLTKLFILYGLLAPLAILHSKDVRRNMLYLVAGIFVNCAITILQASVFPEIVDVLSINPLTPDESEILRYQGLTQFPVTLGLSAALAVLIGIGLMLFENSRYVRWSLAFLTLICAGAALLSGSRIVLAALIPGLLVLALLLKQRRRMVVRGLITVCIITGGIAYLLPNVLEQFSNRLEDVGLVDYGRLIVAAQALLEIAQKPIFGWGVNHFSEAGLTLFPGMYGNEPQGAHVTLLQYWYGAGLLGATGFLALFAVPVRRMVQALRKKLPADSSNAVRLILACYVSIFIIFNLGPYFFNRYLYMPMFAFAGFIAGRLKSAEAHLALQQQAGGRSGL